MPSADPTVPTWRVVSETPLPDDVVVVRLFDAERLPGIPGPVATPETVRRTLGARLAQGDPEHRSFAAGLPWFGYLWQTNEPPRVVDLAEARRMASEAGLELVRDPVSGSLHAIQPGAWELWIVDEEQLRMLRAEATALGVNRAALFVKR